MSARPSDRLLDPHSADTPIAELIRLAGPRPQPSARRTAEARAAVEAEWRHMVRRRWIRRWPSRLAAAAIALLAVVWAARVSFRPASPASPDLLAPRTVATLVTVREPVRVQPRGADAGPIRAGEEVPAGAVIDSGGGGRAAFRLVDGTSLRLDIDTRIVLVDGARLRLERGAVYIDSHGRREASAVHILTAQGVVRDIGTQFEVRAEASGIRIRVREGDVQLDRSGPTASAVPVLVTQAEEVRVGATGAIDRRAILRYGPDWAWLDAILPPFTLEGASLERLLRWVSREGGWTWRFEDAAAARHGSSVVLHGSVDGLTPEEALAAVLPTCGMAHRLREGELVVRLARPDDSRR